MKNQFAKLSLSLIGSMLIISVSCCTIFSLYFSATEYKYTKILSVCVIATSFLWLLTGICKQILKYIIEKVTINIDGSQKKIKSNINNVIFGDSDIIKLTLSKDVVLTLPIAFYTKEMQKLMSNDYEKVDVILTRKEIILKFLPEDGDNVVEIKKELNYKEYLSVRNHILSREKITNKT